LDVSDDTDNDDDDEDFHYIELSIYDDLDFMMEQTLGLQFFPCVSLVNLPITSSFCHTSKDSAIAQHVSLVTHSKAPQHLCLSLYTSHQRFC
jgi:hypothetical protein